MRRFFIIFLAFLIAFSLFGCVDSSEEGYKATLYFLNQSGTKLETEERIVALPKSEGQLANSILKELINGPTRPDLIPSVPEKAAVQKIDVEDGLVTVDFNSDFSFKDEIDRVFACTAVVSTLTSVTGIERVKFYVNGREMRTTDGEPLPEISREDIVYDSQLIIADYKTVKLYFADKNSEKLVPEWRTVTINSKESLEKVLVNELIKGPSTDSTYPTMPTETKVLSVETKEGTCFVNLSQDFKEKHQGGSAAENMTIYSIVNTLTELENVDKVQFLIEGQKVEVFIHSVFNEPFERNEKIISD